MSNITNIQNIRKKNIAKLNFTPKFTQKRLNEAIHVFLETPLEFKGSIVKNVYKQSTFITCRYSTVQIFSTCIYAHKYTEKWIVYRKRSYIYLFFIKIM